MEKFSAEAVYEIMAQIPKGKVVTYGEIATLMGQPQKSAHVGVAMKGAAQRGLPCHRVVFSDGGLVPGWPEQVELLKAEGVIIKKNGKVDMKQSAWRPLDTITETSINQKSPCPSGRIEPVYMKLWKRNV